MAISNELSSDVAAALMANKTSPQELNRLKDIILEVHSVLQKMSKETRADRLDRLAHKEPQEGAKSTGAF